VSIGRRNVLSIKSTKQFCFKAPLDKTK